LAKGYLKEEGVDICFLPEFVAIEIEGKLRIAIKLIIEIKKNNNKFFDGKNVYLLNKYELVIFMDNPQVEKYSSFLDNLRKIPGFNESKNQSIFVSRFTKLCDEYSLIRDQAIKVALHHAPEFNIFDLLGVTRDEVRTHSSMIAELLNPKGNHGQGSMFLDLFVNMCLEKDPANLSFQQYLKHHENDFTNVLTEYHTPFGRMDIVVLNPSIGFLCVIENKIDAYEQANQLERYADWIKTMNKNRSYPYNSLVFLTVRGYVPVTVGTNQYIPLSYKSDILHWIESSLPQIQAPIVHSTLIQYSQMVKRL